MTELALPDDYAGVLIGLKEQVRTARFRVQRQANTKLIHLNWRIGRVLLEQTDRAAWGDKVIQRLAVDLRAEFVGVTGLSLRNLKYMRSFARAWPSFEEIGQHAVAQLPWGHITVLPRRAGSQGLTESSWSFDAGVPAPNRTAESRDACTPQLRSAVGIRRLPMMVGGIAAELVLGLKDRVRHELPGVLVRQAVEHARPLQACGEHERRPRHRQMLRHRRG